MEASFSILGASGVVPVNGTLNISSTLPASGVLQVGANVSGPALTMEWSLAIFLVLLEAIILWFIWRRHINLEKLISEENGVASFSRFQFLIFTFIVASAYIVLAFHSVSTGASLPTIDPSVLGLIGISGGSYLISKGIENSNKDNAAPPTKTGTAATGTTENIAG